MATTVSVSAGYHIHDESAVKTVADTIAYRPSTRYTFAKAAPNEIVDRDSALFRFFEKLSLLRKSADSVKTVSIVHIGDSHIQADFLTGTARKLMNHYFGNPGRGLIAPNRLMRSNNGRHYRITSSNQWKHSFVVKPNSIPIGITGLGLQTRDIVADINISTIDESFPGEWDFNTITTYCDLEKTDVNLLQSNITDSNIINSYAKVFKMDSLTNNVSLSFVSPEREISVSGFNLANSGRGVFYHSIGVNGAKFCDYNNCSESFYAQVASLNPDIVIISLGTNEAMTRTVNESTLHSDMAGLVNSIRTAAPYTAIMFTTPAEVFVRTGRRASATPNSRTGKVRDIIAKFAEQNGFPCWDLFRITGGKGSALEWNKKRLMVRDRIHFTQRGYEYQGELLFEAIVKSYNQYIKERS
ncbi:MAG: GDSL-type esterase/lipase family protein [Prevotellaceae bacterium]|nr:GDSL-type esterase/lipase family protein [Prevotellaceae bacterium]